MSEEKEFFQVRLPTSMLRQIDDRRLPSESNSKLIERFVSESVSPELVTDNLQDDSRFNFEDRVVSLLQQNIDLSKLVLVTLSNDNEQLANLLEQFKEFSEQKKAANLAVPHNGA